MRTLIWTCTLCGFKFYGESGDPEGEAARAAKLHREAICANRQRDIDGR